MRRHWQKKPLLVRQALPGVAPPLRARALFALAARDDVESRLVVRGVGDDWRAAPRARCRDARCRRWRSPAGRCWCRGWTCTVDAAHELLCALSLRARRAAGRPDAVLRQRRRRRRPAHRFLRRVPAAGARPAALARRPRLSQPRLRDDVPLKMLRHFEPEQEWLLEPGDMLYLPPRWAHDGVALGGDCMTASVGFRAPRADELARELLARAGGRSARSRSTRCATAIRGSRPPPRPARCPSRCRALPARRSRVPGASRRRLTARWASGSPNRSRRSGSRLAIAA